MTEASTFAAPGEPIERVGSILRASERNALVLPFIIFKCNRQLWFVEACLGGAVDEASGPGAGCGGNQCLDLGGIDVLCRRRRLLPLLFFLAVLVLHLRLFEHGRLIVVR